MASKYMKARRYESAAEQYGVAISLCDKLPNHADKRTALHNNRCVLYVGVGVFCGGLWGGYKYLPCFSHNDTRCTTVQ